MHIRILSFDGCPNILPAKEIVDALVKELGVEATVTDIRVISEDDAEKYRFLGSPTIQINGKDIERSRRSDKPLFGCRLYKTDDQQTGIPSRGMLEAAIREALNQK